MPVIFPPCQELHLLIPCCIVKSLMRISLHFSPETIRMDIATLIWAILPPLEEQEFSNKCNLICENIGLPIWRKKSREGIWIPFTPSINFLIEQKYGRMMEQSFVESKTIHTVNYKKMQVTNEATLEKT